MSNQFQDKLDQAFSTIDVTKDGTVDWEELKGCCTSMQISLDESDKNDFDRYQGVDSKPGLNFEEFCDFVKGRLWKVFHSVDINGNGFLDHSEITETLKKMGVSVSARQVEGILQSMDKDGDMLVDFNEFCQFFGDVPSPNIQFIAKLWCYGEGLDVGSDVVPLSIPPVEMPLIQFMFAGGVAGIASRTFTAPLEKLKIVAQTSSTNTTKLRDNFLRIYRHEGSRGFFAGNLANCIRVFPTSALVCLVYSRMIKYTPVDNQKNPNQPLWRFISGVTAGVVSTAVTHPLDVVRARLTIQNASVINSSTYTGIFNAFKRIATEEGAHGLYKGLKPSLVSIAPFMGLQQCSYDVLKSHAMAHTGANAYTFLLCGALAGMSAQTVVHPLDVIRRRIQVTATTKPKNFMLALKDLWIDGGMRSIYAGLTASYLKVIPAAASSLLVRDFMLGRLE